MGWRGHGATEWARQGGLNQLNQEGFEGGKGGDLNGKRPLKATPGSYRLEERAGGKKGMATTGGWQGENRSPGKEQPVEPLAMLLQRKPCGQELHAHRCTARSATGNRQPCCCCRHAHAHAACADAGARSMPVSTVRHPYLPPVPRWQTPI